MEQGTGPAVVGIVPLDGSKIKLTNQMEFPLARRVPGAGTKKTQASHGAIDVVQVFIKTSSTSQRYGNLAGDLQQANIRAKGARMESILVLMQALQ